MKKMPQWGWGCVAGDSYELFDPEKSNISNKDITTTDFLNDSYVQNYLKYWANDVFGCSHKFIFKGKVIGTIDEWKLILTPNGKAILILSKGNKESKIILTKDDDNKPGLTIKGIFWACMIKYRLTRDHGDKDWSYICTHTSFDFDNPEFVKDTYKFFCERKGMSWAVRKRDVDRFFKEATSHKLDNGNVEIYIERKKK